MNSGYAARAEGAIAREIHARDLPMGGVFLELRLESGELPRCLGYNGQPNRLFGVTKPQNRAWRLRRCLSTNTASEETGFGGTQKRARLRSAQIS